MPDIKHEHYTSREPKWDKYRRFHVTIAPHVVQFETGEVIVESWGRYEPRTRGTRSTLGLEFVMPHDRSPALKSLHTDKAGTSRVRQSWLLPGTYLVDHEQKQVIRLGHYAHSNTKGLENVPVWAIATGFRAYCGGKGRDWVSTQPVIYRKPMQLTRAEKAHLRDLQRACAAAGRIGALPKDTWQLPFTEDDKRRNPSALVTIPPHREHLSMAYEDLTVRERCNLGRNGWGTAYDEIEQTSLWLA